MPAHRNLTGADLHEPKGVATASAGTVYVANGSGSGSWQELTFPTPPTPTVVVESNTQLPVSPRGTTLVSNGTNWVVVPNVTGPLINLEDHGFVTGQPVYFDGTDWQPAQSDSAATIGSHVIFAVDEDTFIAVISGVITGMSGLVAGSWYFVSDVTAGALTDTEPTAGFSNPVGQAISATSLMVLPYRAQEIV